MSTKNYLFFSFVIFFLTLPTSSFSQQTEDFIGDWKIIKVEISKNAEKEEKAMLELAKKIFLTSTFHFKKNDLFSFDTPEKMLQMKDKIWKFDSAKKYITVNEKGAKSNASLLMGIKVKYVEGQYRFLLDDTNIILTVEKK